MYDVDMVANINVNTTQHSVHGESCTAQHRGDVQLLISGAKRKVGIPHWGRMCIDVLPNDEPGSMVKNRVHFEKTTDRH